MYNSVLIEYPLAPEPEVTGLVWDLARLHVESSTEPCPQRSLISHINPIESSRNIVDVWFFNGQGFSVRELGLQLVSTEDLISVLRMSKYYQRCPHRVWYSTCLRRGTPQSMISTLI
ncbi:hypothetical protein QCA50_002596 [Cerrena zonata]|uniref:Uncharacterized protein n=1 Tax=Cerrena zonata TaxID=2478898 RepID=A0AAW0GUB8_9APHY